MSNSVTNEKSGKIRVAWEAVKKQLQAAGDFRDLSVQQLQQRWYNYRRKSAEGVL